jgi:ABC-type uncharacterized transport system substrate-binding protein
VLILAVFVGPLHAREVVILKSANIAAYNQAVIGSKDPEFTRKGALISFWIDSTDIGREAAHVAQTILAGSTAPHSKTFVPKQRMALNRGTAEYLDIAIPPTVQRMADEMY